MSRLEGEKLIRLIIADVVRECAVRGHGVSDSLAAFMVKAVVLDPRNGFNVDRTLTKQDVQKLEELCLDKLLKKCSPSLDTIKMQVYFNMTYTSRRGFLEEAERAGRSTLSALRRGITESRVNSREQLQAAYRDMVRYTLLQSGLGSASDPRAVQEATAALQSIFPQSKLGVFMVLSRREKEQQLDELSRTVTGIRLFNQASVKGEQQLHAHQLMPAAVRDALSVTSGSVASVLSETQRLSWRYTAALERLTGPDSGPGPCEAPLGLLKQALYNLRQHQHFLNILQADTQACVQHAAVLEAELSSLVEQLKQAVRSRTAVPTTLVSPLFQSLSEVWGKLRDEAELLNTLNSLSASLQPFLDSQANMFPEDYLDRLLDGAELQTDEQRTSRSADERVDPAEMKMRDEDEWLWPEAADFSRLPLQYSGFCGFTLVDRDGLLLPGNPNIGVLKHKEKLYVFSSKRAAVQFSSDPDAFASEVAERAKRSPELIQLLQLHQDLSAAAPPAQMQPGQRFLEKSITKRDSGAQTELHPVVTNIDASYEWNEWELRRKALRLADLRTKVTHSTQTGRSHMRRENASQTWLPKDAACQTKRDGQSGVPTPQVYLAGLRGQRHGQLVKTDLTRPVSPQ
ncbi:cilia- and flagella-associated protein 206 [Salarias fasciatus]|uniref:cilia- and flagella-associated protein 206 n=1 Tax=Salarias fasciatus TaxID=181472 RepID=UPI001176AF91|nr:cilia- and flagella-associated protein 206 [Salarias fasciatus]